jgi:hypothetical protein
MARSGLVDLNLPIVVEEGSDLGWTHVVVGIEAVGFGLF